MIKEQIGRFIFFYKINFVAISHPSKTVTTPVQKVIIPSEEQGHPLSILSFSFTRTGILDGTGK
jgi:hypothetical protein